MAREERRLYVGESGRRTRRRLEEEFEREGETPAEADASYGRVVETVARERAAESPTGEYREYVEPHAEERDGERIRVKGHFATVHAERHSRGHHPGRCGPACRRGETEHKHRSRRRRRRR